MLVEPDPAGHVCVFSSTATHVIVDIVGSMGDTFSGQTPQRLLDTRAVDSDGGRKAFEEAASLGIRLDASVGEHVADLPGDGACRRHRADREMAFDREAAGPFRHLVDLLRGRRQREGDLGLTASEHELTTTAESSVGDGTQPRPLVDDRFLFHAGEELAAVQVARLLVGHERLRR